MGDLSLEASLEGHTDTVWGVAWSPSGTVLATCSADKTAKAWDLRQGGHCLRTLEARGDILKLSLEPQTRRVVALAVGRHIECRLVGAHGLIAHATQLGLELGARAVGCCTRDAGAGW